MVNQILDIGVSVKNKKLCTSCKNDKKAGMTYAFGIVKKLLDSDYPPP